MQSVLVSMYVCIYLYNNVISLGVHVCVYIYIYSNVISLGVHVCVYIFIGRAKRAPHWGVQSRFRVIYICMLSVCLSYVKSRGIT